MIIERGDNNTILSSYYILDQIKLPWQGGLPIWPLFFQSKLPSYLPCKFAPAMQASSLHDMKHHEHGGGLPLKFLSDRLFKGASWTWNSSNWVLQFRKDANRTPAETMNDLPVWILYQQDYT
jgi:hypothetical protein